MGEPCRSAYRAKTPIEGKYLDYGLRVVMETDRKPEVRKAAGEFTDQLKPGRPIRRKHSTGEVHSYHTAIAAGQNLLFELNHEDKNVAVALIGPNGKPVKEAMINETVYNSFPLSQQGGKKVEISLTAKIGGDYRLEIHPKESKAFVYELAVKELSQGGQ